MRKLIFFVVALLSWCSAATAQAPVSWRAKVAPEILTALNQGKTADLLLVFAEKADVSGASRLHGKAVKAQYVYDRLVQTATRTQANARRILRDRQAFANSFYLVNAIAVEKADAALVRQLAELPEVARLSFDPDIHFDGPLPGGSEGVAERGTIEWGVDKINAPTVWALGYTGQGVTVGGSDTGYDWTHPAIQPHYRGWNAADGSANHNYNWHDAIHDISPLSGDSVPTPASNPCGLDSQVPCDDHNHGTHTMGTMVGDDNQGNQIGVAPGAKWIACRNMERGNGKPSSYIECLQWFLAPTDLAGQNADVSKAPQVINNSWYCSYEEGCTDLSVNELLHTAVINLKTSGVVVVVSNGNEGWMGCGSTNGPPAYFEESFSVGATRDVDSIAGFSSRGPVLVDNSLRMKPNVSAPGANVRSCIRNGGYANFSGTSMAGPHVVGLVALMLSAQPKLAGEVEVIEDIIEQTAIPKFDAQDCSDNGGQAYPNNTYGFGRVDAFAAVQKALLYDPTATTEAVLPEVSVFPNPVVDEAVFNLNNCSGKTTLTLFDAKGQQVYARVWPALGQYDRMPVALGGLAQGVYFWEIQAENGTARGKMVKE